jgi:hypothetical protein
LADSVGGRRPFIEALELRAVEVDAQDAGLSIMDEQNLQFDPAPGLLLRPVAAFKREDSSIFS